MKSALVAAMLVAAFSGGPAWSELLKPTIDVKDMRVVIAFVSTRELAVLQRRYGVNLDIRDIRQSHRRGFSILRTKTETGARTCEIYLAEERRPREVNDEGTLSLGHELLHCMYGDYHR